MVDIVKQILAKPIQLADQVTKAADEASSSKQECLELKSKTEKLVGLLRQTASASFDLYECTTLLIFDETEQVLDKALSLVLNGIMKRVFTIIPAAQFLKMSSQLENSIGDLSWLLRGRLRLIPGKTNTWGYLQLQQTNQFCASFGSKLQFCASFGSMLANCDSAYWVNQTNQMCDVADSCLPYIVDIVAEVSEGLEHTGVPEGIPSQAEYVAEYCSSSVSQQFQEQQQQFTLVGHRIARRSKRTASSSSLPDSIFAWSSTLFM
ncbi:hypothetical protein ACFX11_037143 [Malus domestica]